MTAVDEVSTSWERDCRGRRGEGREGGREGGEGRGGEGGRRGEGRGGEGGGGEGRGEMRRRGIDKPKCKDANTGAGKRG